MRQSAWIACLLVLWSVAPAWAQQTPAGLADLPLQDLLAIEVTSVARKEQTVARTAAAITVITADDIRRSGATTVPDLLRRVPGLSVAQLTANIVSVTSRGFGGIYANKLLVLIDGRSVYSPLTGGVHWEMQMLPLDAVQRIEVIRGSGGSLWGANAINGVINIITKRADESGGAAVRTRVGGLDQSQTDVRVGGRLGDASHGALYASYRRRATPGRVSGEERSDLLSSGSLHARVDWTLGEADRLSATADVQEGELTEVRNASDLAPPFTRLSREIVELASSHLQLAWNRTHSSRVESAARVNYGRERRDGSGFGQHLHVVSVEGQQRRALGTVHELVAGGEYRFWSGDLKGGPLVSVAPAEDNEHLVTAFVEDELALAARVRVTPGLKVERNGDTGVELLPSLRALWTPADGHTIWGAVSRAVRTPNRFDRGVHVVVAVTSIGGPLPLAVTIDGSPAIAAESLRSFEVGHRIARGPVGIDVTAFTGRYHDLLGLEQRAPVPAFEFGQPVLRLSQVLVNSFDGSTAGIEAQVTWTPVRRWQAVGSYAFAHVELTPKAGSAATADVPINRPVPEHQWHARSQVELSRAADATVMLYRVSGIDGVAPAHTRLDARVRWTVRGRLELVAGAQNLLHDDTIEFADPTGPVPAPVGPTAFAEVAWRF